VGSPCSIGSLRGAGSLCSARWRFNRHPRLSINDRNRNDGCGASPRCHYPCFSPPQGHSCPYPPQHAGHYAFPCSLPSPSKTGSHPVTPCQAKALLMQQVAPESLTTSTASWSVTRANRVPCCQLQCPGLFTCSGKGFPCRYWLRGGDIKSPSRCRVRSMSLAYDS